MLLLGVNQEDYIGTLLSDLQGLSLLSKSMLYSSLHQDLLPLLQHTQPSSSRRLKARTSQRARANPCKLRTRLKCT